MLSWRAVRDWILDRLTRRRAWTAIVVIVVWNVALGGVLVRQALKDDLPIASLVPQLAIVPVVIVGVSVWLLRQSKAPSD